MHTVHQDLGGYDPGQIWFDGCAECEHRGETVPSSIGYLDNTNMARAWDRSLAWSADELDPATVSNAERPLLRYLEQVRFTNERVVQALRSADDEMGERLGAIDIEEELDVVPSRYSRMDESGVVDQ